MTIACNSNVKASSRRWMVLGLVVLSVTVGTGATSIDNQNNDPRNVGWDIHIDGNKVVGAEACQKCHAAEINTWKQTPHAETFLTLHRKKEAQTIASKLGIASFKSDSNCVQCHYTMQQKPTGLEAIAGVSCESCHGAAKDWVSIHQDYGPGSTRLTESSEHRRKRLTESIALECATRSTSTSLHNRAIAATRAG